MSGFEIAGVVLGAIPLVISALEHYRTGAGVIGSFLKWRGRLDTLLFRLKLQKTFFHLDAMELLRVADIDLGFDHCGDLSEEDCIAVLTETMTEIKVQQLLGQRYNLLLEILRRYEHCLKTIVRKIKHIRRLPDVPTPIVISPLIFHLTKVTGIER